MAISNPIVFAILVSNECAQEIIWRIVHSCITNINIEKTKKYGRHASTKKFIMIDLKDGEPIISPSIIFYHVGFYWQ